MRRLALSAVAGVAAGLAFEPYHWSWLLPLAVATVTLLAATTHRLRAGFAIGFVFGTAFMLVLLTWVQVIGVYAWVPLAAVEGLFYGLVGLATAAVAGPGVRLRGWPVWVAAAWAGAEALRELVPFGGFPWGRLAFAVEDTPVAPAFAYVGAPGVTFLVALVGTSLAWAALRVRRTPLRAGAGVAAALAVSCLAAVLPWAVPTSAAPKINVAAVQGDVPGQGLDAFAERRAVLDNHVEATLRLAERVDEGTAPRPDVVVWPENSSDIDPYTDAAARAAIGSAAQAIGAPLMMGAVVGDRSEGWHNREIVWSPDGNPGDYYDKIHPVPFGEYIPLRSTLAPRIPALDQIPSDMIRGDRPGVLRVGPATVGVLMCFEVAYDGMLHDLVDAGADLVVVPTNNATYTGTGQVEQQFAMSRLRAIETGRFLVVASTNGISGIVAPDGHVVEGAASSQPAVLQHAVSLLTRQTPATRLGPWPERALAGVALLSLLVGLRVRRRRRETGSGPGPTTGRAPTATSGSSPDDRAPTAEPAHERG